MPKFRHSIRPRHIPARRWPRRILVTVNVIVGLSLIGAAGAYGYVRYRIDSIRTVAAPHLTRTKDAGASENILLIGNETRAGLNPSEVAAMGSPTALSGSLSDVIMILHLDPVTHAASILSIPRDLFVAMPPGTPSGPWEKIDSALNDGAKGPDNLIDAIQRDFGIPIHHYVELNFDGFQHTVNALGGIDMDFPEPLYDLKSNLDIPTTGCLKLSGAQALALVRSRHLQYDPPGDSSPQASWPTDPESDLARITRDHVFVRVLYSTAVSEGLSDPIKLNSFIGAVIDQVTIDPALKGQLISLGSEWKGLDPNTIPETTLPVTTIPTAYRFGGANMGDVDFPVQPNDNQTIAAWDSGALPAPVVPTAVNVLNAVGGPHLAATTSQALVADGLPAGTTGDTTERATPLETFVDYPPGGLAQAVAVMQKLSGAVMLNPDAQIPRGTVTVEAGTTFSVAPPATVAPPTTVGTSSTTVASSPSGTTAAPPTYGHQAPSASTDNLTAYDPRPCPPGMAAKAP